MNIDFFTATQFSEQFTVDTPVTDLCSKSYTILDNLVQIVKKTAFDHILATHSALIMRIESYG